MWFHVALYVTQKPFTFMVPVAGTVRDVSLKRATEEHQPSAEEKALMLKLVNDTDSKGT